VTDLESRADRIQIAEGNFGCVLVRNNDIMIVEIPAGLAPGVQWGVAGFIPVFTGARRHCRSSRRPHGWPRVFARAFSVPIESERSSSLLF
jgi:hypothetical protein